MVRTFHNPDVVLPQEPLSFTHRAKHSSLMFGVYACEQAAKVIQYLLGVSVRRHFANAVWVRPRAADHNSLW
jgi:hypothetical protein